MSLKENVEQVKLELNSEEKFLESFVKVERFYKKNKLLIIIVIAALVIGGIAYNVNNYLKEQNQFKANVLFEKVLKDSKDTTSLAELKELNTKLYEIALFKQAQASNKEIKLDYTPYFKELAEYEKALKAQDLTKLNDLSMNNDFLLKEFAIFNKAMILTNEGKYEEARNTLKLIPETSQVKELVAILNHHLITK